MSTPDSGQDGRSVFSKRVILKLAEGATVSDAVRALAEQGGSMLEAFYSASEYGNKELCPMAYGIACGGVSGRNFSGYKFVVSARSEKLEPGFFR